jgi:hypothetical protein
MEELTKHPYYSSKDQALILYRKTRHRHLPHEGEGQAAPGSNKSDRTPYFQEAQLSSTAA